MTEEFNTPEYTLKGIGSTLRQGIASESNDFKHQKLCEAHDFLIRYESGIKNRKIAKEFLCLQEAMNIIWDAGYTIRGQFGIVIDNRKTLNPEHLKIFEDFRKGMREETIPAVKKRIQENDKRSKEIMLK